MSYTIVYDKRFIKTKHGIIPLLLAGSNNCYQSNGRGVDVRERSWQCFTYADRPMSAEAIMEKVESMVPSTYGEHFMYNGKWVSDDGLVNFFKTGIKNAMTLDELKEKYRVNRLRVKLFVKDDSSFGGKSIVTKYFTESDEMDSELDDMLEQISNLSPDLFPCFDYQIEADWQTGVNMRLKPIKKTRRKSGNKLESGFLLKFADDTYFTKRSSVHMWRDPFTSRARHFRSAEEAGEYWKSNLLSYQMADEVSIVARKVIIVRTKTDEAIEYWTGISFVADRAQAEEFSSQAAASDRKSSNRFSKYAGDVNIHIQTSLTPLMTLKKEVAR